MKTKLISVMLVLYLLFGLVGCGVSNNKDDNSDNVSSNTPTDSESQDEDISQNTDESDASETEKTIPDGDIVDGALATKENPVTIGTWASITVSDGGWPKPAYARISNVITDQTEVQALIDEYNNKNSGDTIVSLEEHAEFLDYVIAEYEVYFPDNFTDSDSVSFSGLILSRENNQDQWIASDGSNYYWMGSETRIDVPSSETGYPQNGDTVTCKVAYPMIKGYTDYTLQYKERTEDLSETIETYFAIK